MAMNTIVFVVLFFTLAHAKADESSTIQLLKASVTCLDCSTDSDLSGIQVLVKCEKVKKLAVVYTEEDGNFQTELPSDKPESSNSANCMAKIMGAPYQIYISQNSFATPVIAKDNQYFTVVKPLRFYKSCPLKGKCGSASSKTVYLPMPKEWGFAPTSYYIPTHIIPVMPIIGIP